MCTSEHYRTDTAANVTSILTPLAPVWTTVNTKTPSTSSITTRSSVLPETVDSSTPLGELVLKR